MLIEELSHDECLAVLNRTRLGRLGCSFENQPYVVPIYFVYDRSDSGGEFLYGFTTPGQKVQWMRANPLVCVECDEVTTFDQWTSIIVFGRYEELPDTGDEMPATRTPMRATLPPTSPKFAQERLRAHDLLQEYALWWQPGFAAFVSRSESGKHESYRIVYYRIRIDQITGHRATPKKSDSSP